MYQAKPAARTLFDEIARNGVDDNRTTVDELIQSGEVSRRQAITLLRDLEEAGYGEFKVGRKGHPSRLEWREDPRALAERVLTGEAAGSDDVLVAVASDELEPVAEPPSTPPSSESKGELFPEMFAAPEGYSNPLPKPSVGRSRNAGAGVRKAGSIEHSYVLRRGLRVVVELPEDLSAREAEILADWVRNLSFER